MPAFFSFSCNSSALALFATAATCKTKRVGASLAGLILTASGTGFSCAIISALTAGLTGGSSDFLIFGGEPLHLKQSTWQILVVGVVAE